MRFSAIKIPYSTNGFITISEASVRNLSDWPTVTKGLPPGWQGKKEHSADSESAEGAIYWQSHPEAGFEPLQLLENTRYFLCVSGESSSSAQLKPSDFDLEPVPDTTDKFFFTIYNYLGTAWLKVGDHAPCRFDVISRKLNYHREYRAMVEAIAGQCNQLLLEWSAPTSLRFASDPAKQNRILLEQFLFLRHVLSSEKLELYLEVIRRNPHNILQFDDEWKSAGNSEPAPGYFEQPMRFGRDWMPGDGISSCPQPAQLISRRKYETLNTPANAFIKFALENFQDLCERVINCFRESRGTAWKEADDMRDRLDAFLATPFFGEIQSLSYLPSNNQTLQKREGYREIFHAWLMMQAAAQLDWPGREDAYDGTTRDVPTLYEYWLYFVMRRIMHNLEHTYEVKITGEDTKTTKPFIERSSDGLRLNLKQGQTSLSAFSWSPPETKSELRIHFYFNRIFAPHSSSDEKAGKEVLHPGSYSRPFRPDYSLVIFPENYAVSKSSVKALLEAEKRAEMDCAIAFLHFDAKYRVETLEGIFGKPPKKITNDCQGERRSK